MVFPRLSNRENKDGKQEIKRSGEKTARTICSAYYPGHHHGEHVEWRLYKVDPVFASPVWNNALTPYFSPNEPTASGSSSPKPPQTPPAASPSPAPVVEPEPEPEDILLRAEKTKEKGNVAFKGGKYAEAVDLYTSAIGAQDHIRCFNQIYVILIHFFFSRIEPSGTIVSDEQSGVVHGPEAIPPSTRGLSSGGVIAIYSTLSKDTASSCSMSTGTGIIHTRPIHNQKHPCSRAEERPSLATQRKSTNVGEPRQDLRGCMPKEGMGACETGIG